MIFSDEKFVFGQFVTIGNQIFSILRFGNDKNLWIFFLLLSNVIGIGRVVAKASKRTFLIDCRMLIKISSKMHSARSVDFSDVFGRI